MHRVGGGSKGSSFSTGVIFNNAVAVYCYTSLRYLDIDFSSSSYMS